MNKETEQEELFTEKELAEKFKVTFITIRAYRKEGMPVATKAPVRYYYSECLEWLKGRERRVNND